MLRKLSLLLVCCILLTIPVWGAQVDTWNVTAQVAASGSAAVSVELIVSLETPVNRLVFPLGAGAKGLTVNGVAYRVRKVNGTPCALLESSTGFSGTLRFQLNYTLRSCLDKAGQWDLVLPLLADGVEYPVQRMEFQIVLPDTTAELPDFESSYLGADVDNYMAIAVQDNVISGSVNTALRDHEALTMTLATDPAAFPRNEQTGSLTLPAVLAATALFLLAAGYWLLRLRWQPVRIKPRPQKPVGLNPGLLSCELLTHSPELPLLVICWAQCGYLTIHLDRDQGVTLHKRMDMGNERSPYECKLFYEIFGRGQMAEAASRRFQALRAQVESSRPKVGTLFSGGSVLLMRLLAALSCGLSFVVLADGLPLTDAPRILLLIAMGLCGCVVSWLLLPGFQSLLHWDKRPGCIGAVCAGLILASGISTGRTAMAVVVLLEQTVLGLSIVFGPRRTAEGQQALQSILGLRKALRSMGSKQVNRIILSDPGYYYTMAPYALALGVDRRFAKRFQSAILPECLWLIRSGGGAENASQFAALLRQAAKSMRGKLPAAPPRSRKQRSRRRT